jgi:glyoxylase-like metal-dependent hydrolase (beta-lactamase superfamily II)
VKLQTLVTGYCLADESHFMQGGVRGKQVRCPARVYVFTHPREGVVLFDTGYAPRVFTASERLPYRLYRRITPIFTRPEEAALHQLAALGIAPGDVRWIIASHFHADHIAGLLDFPQARFVASVEGLADVTGRSSWGSLRRAFLPELLPPDFAHRARLLARSGFTDEVLPELGPTSDLFGDGLLLAVPLPGHARGQMGLLARTTEGEALLVADAAYSRRAIRENRPPHPITALFADDYRAGVRTLAALQAFAQAHPDVALHPTHEPFPGEEAA